MVEQANYKSCNDLCQNHCTISDSPWSLLRYIGVHLFPLVLKYFSRGRVSMRSAPLPSPPWHARFTHPPGLAGTRRAASTLHAEGGVQLLLGFPLIYGGRSSAAAISRWVFNHSACRIQVGERARPGRVCSHVICERSQVGLLCC